ncbi:DegT/DnrJ/EryC1/StrS family aminotransferase [Candidatus Pelagibacter sp. Uisw_136]|uniref:DegT/DnrJ/EryC1/StrS family aminotransferase n=1 Tax=Candidatus Pelagibacter sp. Uisw_136 TaxID=3230991 RepID=UPI0039E73EA5
MQCPVPIHLQPAAKKLGYVKSDFPVTEVQSKRIVTLPIHQDLKKNEIVKICKLVNNFTKLH